MSMAMRRGPRPLTWRNPDQGLRAWFVAERGGVPATTQQAASPAGRGNNPAIAIYRFRTSRKLKVNRT